MSCVGDDETAVHQAVGHWEWEGEGILARQVFVLDEPRPVLRSGDSITFPPPPHPAGHAVATFYFWE